MTWMDIGKHVSPFSFCPVLDELLVKNRAVGRNGKRFETLPALSSLNNLKTIYRLMLHFAPARTLEIGFAFGGSALLFCSLHKQLGHQPERQHVLIDPFQKTTWDSCGLMALERAGLSAFADFRAQPSAIVLPKLLEAEQTFEFAYVDGSHLFEDVFLDAHYIIRMLTIGGIVAFDDSTNPHVAKVLGFLRSSIASGLEELDLGRFRESASSISYRLARRLGRVQLTAFRRVADVERTWDAPFYSF
jgi:cephalosporin hydroxylase